MKYILKYLLPILLACVLGAGGASIIFAMHSGTQSVEEERPSSEQQDNDSKNESSVNTDLEEEEAEEVNTYENMSWEEAGVQTNTEGVVNVLLIGRDAREDEADRSDSMILMSINQNSQQITMISFMRDLFVEIEGYNSQKLNAAYMYGGAELLTDTIKMNFDVDIDYTVEINFEGFQDAIDAIGGIDIEIDETEASYLRGETGNNHNGRTGYYTDGRTYEVDAGIVHMDGQMALDYARMRHAGNADYERTLRQRKLLMLIFEKAKSSNWLTLFNLYNEVKSYIETDMSMLQMLSVGYTVYTMDVEGMNSYRIPANGMFDEVRDPTYGAVLTIRDWDETKELIWNYLYSDDGGKAAYEQLILDHGIQESMSEDLSEDALSTTEESTN